MTDTFLAARNVVSHHSTPLQYKLSTGTPVSANTPATVSGGAHAAAAGTVAVRRESFTNLLIDENTFSPPKYPHTAAISPIKPIMHQLHHPATHQIADTVHGTPSGAAGDSDEDDDLLNTLNEKENMHTNRSQLNNNVSHADNHTSKSAQWTEAAPQQSAYDDNDIQYDSRRGVPADENDILSANNVLQGGDSDVVPYGEYDDLCIRYDRLSDELLEVKRQNTALRKQASDALHINNNVQFHNKIAELEAALQTAHEQNKTLQNEVRKLSKAIQVQAEEISDYPQLINSLQNTITSNQLKIKQQTEAINQHEAKSRKQHEYCVSLEQKCRKLQDLHTGAGSRRPSRTLHTYSSHRQLATHNGTPNPTVEVRPVTAGVAQQLGTSARSSTAVRGSAALSRQASHAELLPMSRASSQATLSRVPSQEQLSRQSTGSIIPVYSHRKQSPPVTHPPTRRPSTTSAPLASISTATSTPSQYATPVRQGTPAAATLSPAAQITSTHMGSSSTRRLTGGDASLNTSTQSADTSSTSNSRLSSDRSEVISNASVDGDVTVHSSIASSLQPSRRTTGFSVIDASAIPQRSRTSAQPSRRSTGFSVIDAAAIPDAINTHQVTQSNGSAVQQVNPVSVPLMSSQYSANHSAAISEAESLEYADDFASDSVEFA